jgi:hypothetical protein
MNLLQMWAILEALLADDLNGRRNRDSKQIVASPISLPSNVTELAGIARARARSCRQNERFSLKSRTTPDEARAGREIDFGGLLMGQLRNAAASSIAGPNK